jgi:hypothetical protein
MVLSIFALLFGHLSRGRRPERRFRPALEALEERWVLSTITVLNANDSGSGSLRDALQIAANGDTIAFSQTLVGQTITLTSGQLNVFRSVRIEGLGANFLTVSGNDSSRVLEVFSPSTVSIFGLTITHGKDTAFGGAGLYNFGNLTLTDCAIVNNSFEPTGFGTIGGGGIGNGGPLTLVGCTVAHNNVTRGFGGGIYNGFGTVTLTDSTVADNTVLLGDGGGILNNRSLTVDRCTIADNSAAADLGGGGIFNNGFDLSITASTISGNSGPTGGGIYSQGPLTVTASTLSGNAATAGFGGGLFNQADLTLTDSTVSGNTATGGNGGGIYESFGSTSLITSCTITLNTATGAFFSGRGGGLSVLSGPGVLVEVQSTIIAGNSASTAAPDVDGRVTSQGFNLVGERDGSSGWAPSDILGTTADPVDPLLGPLQDNGGPTLTHALLAGSPALAAGDPALLGTADQRGTLRLGHVDIGAFQAGTAVAFRVTAPGVVQPGEAFDLTVVAVDAWGNTASTYIGTVSFASTDPEAGLPDAYPFAAAEGGAHSFTVTLETPGVQQVTVTDVDNSSLAGEGQVLVLDS